VNVAFWISASILAPATKKAPMRGATCCGELDPRRADVVLDIVSDGVVALVIPTIAICVTRGRCVPQPLSA
jgi:hypothetical protein